MSSRNHARTGLAGVPPQREPGGTSRLTFEEPAALKNGDLYHLVVENISEDPSTDYASLNHLFTFEDLEPRQPRFEDIDLAILGSDEPQGGSWSVDPRAVRDAARVCARVAVSAGDPDAASLVEALADDPLRGALDVTATNALFNRVVAYVDRRA